MKNELRYFETMSKVVYFYKTRPEWNEDAGCYVNEEQPVSTDKRVLIMFLGKDEELLKPGRLFEVARIEQEGHSAGAVRLVEDNGRRIN